MSQDSIEVSSRDFKDRELLESLTELFMEFYFRISLGTTGIQWFLPGILQKFLLRFLPRFPSRILEQFIWKFLQGLFWRSSFIDATYRQTFSQRFLTDSSKESSQNSICGTSQDFKNQGFLRFLQGFCQRLLMGFLLEFSSRISSGIQGFILGFFQGFLTKFSRNYFQMNFQDFSFFFRHSSRPLGMSAEIRSLYQGFLSEFPPGFV